jgi:hypothetical protein
MRLTSHLALSMNPAALAGLRAAAEAAELSDSAWVRVQVARGYEGLLAGAPQPPPLGEYRGSAAARRLLVIRCLPQDNERAKALAAARGVSVSHMVRDMVARSLAG